MVNAKHVAFKVQKQTPVSQPLIQAYSTVINCRKPTSKRARARKEEEASHHVSSANDDGALKRKRTGDGEASQDGTDERALSTEIALAPTLRASREQPWVAARWGSPQPAKLRRRRISSKGVDLDCWFTILSFSDPAQLLEMRSKIASCYRFLRDNPMLWRHARHYYYGDDMPDPPAELSEFQFAHLRHGHGCMSCGAKSTRKTYWAFLRRWCKTCLQSKTVKEHDAMVLLRNADGDDISGLYKCLPSGMFDSWGNYVGVGPANTHPLKTIYLLSDVQEFVAEYISERQVDPESWPKEIRTWANKKMETVSARRAFANQMETWEDRTRATRSLEHQAKKTSRKAYFEHKALLLNPAISAHVMARCPSYQRAIAIPKEPNNTSWLQLKPKLIKEAAEYVAQNPPPGNAAGPSTSGTSTPVEHTHGHCDHPRGPVPAGAERLQQYSLPALQFPPSHAVGARIHLPALGLDANTSGSVGNGLPLSSQPHEAPRAYMGMNSHAPSSAVNGLPLPPRPEEAPRPQTLPSLHFLSASLPVTQPGPANAMSNINVQHPYMLGLPPPPPPPPSSASSSRSFVLPLLTLPFTLPPPGRHMFQ